MPRKNDPTSGSPIRAAYMYPSIYLGLYPDGRVGPGKDGSLSNTLALPLLEGGEKKTVSNTMTGKFSLSYKPIKDLTLTANLTPTVGTVSIKGDEESHTCLRCIRNRCYAGICFWIYFQFAK